MTKVGERPQLVQKDKRYLTINLDIHTSLSPIKGGQGQGQEKNDDDDVLSKYYTYEDYSL